LFFPELPSMLRRHLLRLVTFVPLVGWLGRWSSVPRAVAAGQDPNAAALYRNAFGWAAGLPPDDRQRLKNIATRTLDDAALDGLLDRAGAALESIRGGAVIPSCRWEHETLAVDDLNADQLDFRNLDLIRVACLSARRRIDRGQFREALDDAFAGLTLAHRLGAGGVLIARVQESAGEIVAFETLGCILPDLDPAALDDLARRLDALPAPEPASAVIGPEASFIVGSSRAKLMTMGPEISDDDWGELDYGAEAAATLKRLTGGQRAALITHYESTRHAFAELARLLDLTRSQCHAALDAFAQAERSVHPVVAMLVEKAWWHRWMVDRMRALRVMLRAGIALVRGGERAFLEVADPYGNGPFALQRRGNGFLIRSALRQAEQPEVTLAIGAAG
jgi:hypothetical protein